MSARVFFASLRNIRSRINAHEFMELFHPERPFDDYHMRRWEMFRDDICGFWCHSDTDQQKILETLVSEMEVLV
tara:strand:+ start:112 stop:333 length:222 start_codon:yes stop_codon:yes gene_type:complete